MIDSKDISVVVQGAIDNIETRKCLISIRKYLPDAEIILSTWEGSDTSSLDYDQVIYNKDPGAIIIDESDGKKIYNNMNRQLLSTQSGLDKVKRKYTLKVRSDLILNGNSFLKYFDKFQKRIDNYKLFERKIIIPSLVTRYYINLYKKSGWALTPFHFSDWWFFGLTKDVKTYFSNTSLVKEPDFSFYFRLKKNIDKKNPYFPINFKFAPEQYFGYSCFSQYYPNIKMEDASDYNEEINFIYKICLVNNFIVLDYKQSDIYLNKYLFSKCEFGAGEQYLGLCNFYKYQLAYKKHCDTSYKLQLNSIIHKTKNIEYALLRLYKHIYSFLNPETRISKKIEKLFISIPFSVLNLMIKILKTIIFGVENANQ